MQLSTLVVLLGCTAGVIGDLHKSLYCTSRFQPINNDNSCKAFGGKRDTSVNERGLIQPRAYADNEEATRKACAAYRRRNTGNKKWDKCPDCHTRWYRTPGPNYCVNACDSPAGHLGGDEFLYYCKQNGADGSTDI